MNTEQLVSIIMPMYNADKFVETAIKSVLAQSYLNWELIVIDDGSTDNSVSIVQSYVEKDSRIRLLNNPNPTKMPSSPRNKGLLKAKGKYIAFLDSDDVWLPSKLANQVKLLQQENVAIVYSNYDKINESGEKIGRSIKAPAYSTYYSLLKGNVIGNLTGIYDQQKVGIIPILNIHHEDYAMWLTILKKGFIAKNTQSIEAQYRLQEHSISRNKLKVIAWQWHIYRKIEHISVVKSVYFFINYAIKAFIKTL